MVNILTSPGVDVSVTDESIYALSFPGSRPLFILATRSDKTLPDGTGTALGTSESNVLRYVTSQREVLQLLGNPTFVTAAGVTVQGDETNEYGLHSLWSFLKGSASAYYVRADIDLGQLIPTTVEPTSPPADGTYWIDKDAIVGGIFRRTAADDGWDAVPFRVFTTTPSGGSAGDWAFDYSDTDAQIHFKTDAGTWTAVGGANLTSTAINSRNATTNTLWVSDAAPTGAGANDFWWKTSSASSGTSVPVYQYRASDDTWVAKTYTRSATQPTPTDGTLWEDISTSTTNGKRILKLADGAAFSILTYTIQDAEPTADPVNGQLWYDDTITNFKMYIEDTNAWEEIVTTTSASPTDRQKVISESAPLTPNSGAIWIDISGANLDSFPVVKRYNGSAWEEITDSVSITDTYTAASSVTNGTYWINTGDPATKNTVKIWDDTYEPIILSGGTPAAFDEAVNRRWKPHVGARFGRKGQRYAVVRALQAIAASNDDIRSQAYYYQLMSAPGYPELYDELVSLNADIGEIAFIVGDMPSRLIASGVPVGMENTVSEWKTNANSASVTGEDGFTSSGYPYAAFWYPWGMSTNVDGEDIMIPASTIALRTIAYNDTIAYPWYAPMGDERGLVLNATSVGYLGDDGEYHGVRLTKGQQNVLYENNINPIVYFHNTGLRVWGQKTTYGVNTDLNRINVARLIVKMKYDLAASLRAFIGQPADPLTWASAKNLVEKYLAGLKSLRALYDYAVRVDENNNTPSRIANNEMWVDIAIKPIKVVEFIYVPIKLVAQTDSVNSA